MLGIDVLGLYLVGIAPVDIVHLYLRKIPMIFVMKSHHLVELILSAMERPTQVADTSSLAFLHEEIKDTVVDEALLKVTLAILHAAKGMEQVIIDVVYLQFLERLAIHLDAGLIGPIAEVAHLGGNEPFLAWMTAEGDARGLLRHTLEVDRGGVEVVDTVLDGIVNHLIDEFLIEFGVGMFTQGAAAFDGQSHHAESKEGDLLTVGVGAHGHLVGGHLAGGVALGLDGIGVVAAGGHRGTRHDGPGETFEELSSVHKLSLVDDFFAGFALLAAGPEAVDLADVAGGGEGLDLVVLHPGQDLAELVLGEEHLEFDALLAAVAAGDLVEGAAAVELVDDVLADALVLLGDDAEALVVVEGGGEVVDHEAVDPGADEADDDHAEVVDEEGGAADDGTGDGDGGSDVEVEELVDDLGQDVEAAGGGVDAEHQGLRSAEQQHEAAEVEPGVAHDGGGAGDEVVVGDVLPGEDGIPEVGQGAEDEGRVDGLEAELAVDEQEGHDEQDDVDAHDPGAEAMAAGEDVGEDDGETGDGTDDELGGYEEVVDGGGGDHHAEGHDDQFLPEFPGADIFDGFVDFCGDVTHGLFLFFSSLLLFLFIIIFQRGARGLRHRWLSWAVRGNSTRRRRNRGNGLR